MYYADKTAAIPWRLIVLFIGVAILEMFLGLGVLVSSLGSGIFIAALLVIIISLINPHLGIIALIVSIPFNHGKFNILLTNFYELSFVHIMVLCVTSLYLIDISVNRKVFFKKSPLDALILAFLAWALLSATWAPNIFVAAVHFFLLTILFFSYFVTNFAISDLKSLEYALWGWWLVGLAFSSLGILQYTGIVEIEELFTTNPLEGYSRVFGLSGSPSAFARIMMLSFFTVLGAFHFYETWNKKLLMGACLIFCLFAIVTTLSRSAFLGLFFGLLLYSYRYISQIFSKLIPLLMLIGIVFVVFGSLLGAEFEDRLISMLDFYKQPSWLIRVAVWSASLSMLLDTYGLGVGLGGMEVLFEKYFSMPFSVGNVPSHAHSIYLDVLTHFGVVGFSIFIILGVKLGLYCYRYQKKLGNSRLGKIFWPLCCGLVAIAAQLTITGVLHVSELGIYIGMTVACAKIAEIKST